MSNLHLIPMEKAHIPAVAQLEKSLFSAPWDEASLESELHNPLSLWLVAMDGDTLAGYIGSQSVLGESDMMNLAVAPVYRRQGIGRQLVEGLIAALSAENHCLTLEVRASNAPAIRLYETMGFLTVGRRPRYYQRPTEDALILRKDW